MYKKYLPVFVLVLISLSLLYFFLTIPKPPSSSPVVKNISYECEEGEIKDCITLDGCEGTIQCNNGKWGDCVVPKICVPGSKLKCMEGCLVGYKECNECGTAYLGCVFS